MTGTYGLRALCLMILLTCLILPARAQMDRYEEQDVSVAPKAREQLRRGDRLAKDQHFEEAVAAYRQALSLQPDYAQAYHQMGLAYAALNRYPEAVKALEKAAQLRPRAGLIYENLGVAYVKMGRWGKLGRDQEARAQFAEALRLQPKMAKAHVNLGLAYLNLGLLDKAGKSLTEAVRLAPQDPQARYALCVYYARRGDTQAASREFQTLKKLDPNLAQRLSNRLRAGTSEKRP
jgi:Flp pilus assembly protein TadD